MILAAVASAATFISFGAGGFGRTLGWVFLALTLLLVAAAIWIMALPPLLVALTAQGFRLGRPAAGTVRRGHWATVSDVSTAQGPAGQQLTFTLESGQIGAVPLMLVPRRADELQREVHERLNAAHGYRPLT